MTDPSGNIGVDLPMPVYFYTGPTSPNRTGVFTTDARGIPSSLSTNNSIATLGAFFYLRGVNMFLYRKEELNEDIDVINSVAFHVRQLSASVATRNVSVLVYETKDSIINYGAGAIAAPMPMPAALMPPGAVSVTDY